MSPREGELSRGAVVELRPRPGSGAVTEGAILREAGRGMIGVRRLLEIGQVAARAAGRSSGEFVPDMTLRTLHRRVRTGQRELRTRVVEFGVLPVRRVVADRAILRKAGCDVIRIGRFLKIREVTTHALGRSGGEVVAGVAYRALYGRVCPGQRELSNRVIEFRILPARRVMAYGTILRKRGGDVIWARRLLKVLEVTARALCRSGRKAVAEMALRALQRCMRSREGEFHE